jgi:hypothetical protein
MYLPALAIPGVLAPAICTANYFRGKGFSGCEMHHASLLPRVIGHVTIGHRQQLAHGVRSQQKRPARMVQYRGREPIPAFFRKLPWPLPLEDT